MRLPRPPAVVASTVVVGATPIDPEATPRPVRSFALKALKDGAQVIVTVALGIETVRDLVDHHFVERLAFIETHAVRVTNQYGYRVGVWGEGKYRCGYHLCAIHGAHRLTARDLGTLGPCIIAGSDTITSISST